MRLLMAPPNGQWQSLGGPGRRPAGSRHYPAGASRAEERDEPADAPSESRTLEQPLGHQALHGCVCIPAEMDRFLDVHSVLDRNYERDAQKNRRFAAQLLPDRTQIPLTSDVLVVIDSSENS